MLYCSDNLLQAGAAETHKLLLEQMQDFVQYTVVAAENGVVLLSVAAPSGRKADGVDAVA